MPRFTMPPRNNYSIRKDGRHFTQKKLELYRKDLCQALRRDGKGKIADTYEKMTLIQFANQGGYVIVKR